MFYIWYHFEETDLKAASISECRIIQELGQVATCLDGTVVLGLERRSECLAQKGVIKDRNVVVGSFLAVDEALNRIPAVVQNKTIRPLANATRQNSTIAALT